MSTKIFFMESIALDNLRLANLLLIRSDTNVMMPINNQDKIKFENFQISVQHSHYHYFLNTMHQQ